MSTFITLMGIVTVLFPIASLIYGKFFGQIDVLANYAEIEFIGVWTFIILLTILLISDKEKIKKVFELQIFWSFILSSIFTFYLAFFATFISVPYFALIIVGAIIIMGIIERMAGL